MSATEGVPLLNFSVSGDARVLRATAMWASEEISKPFEVTVEMVSDQASIDADSMLYKPACLTVVRQHTGKRYFHGIISSFVGTGTPIRGQWSYTAVLVPRLWFMTHTKTP